MRAGVGDAEYLGELLDRRRVTLAGDVVPDLPQRPSLVLGYAGDGTPPGTASFSIGIFCLSHLTAVFHPVRAFLF